MEIPKPVRRFFSADYREYQSQLKKFEKTLPKGAPSLMREGKKPVGPNAFERMSVEEQKNARPDYPVRYQIPARPGENGLFWKSECLVPTGAEGSLITGPRLLDPEHRVPGHFDYSQIPDITISPVQPPDAPPFGTLIPKNAKTGLPAHPDTGFPTLPKFRKGSYTHEEQYPPPPLQHRADGPSRRRKPSLDSLGYLEDSD